MKSLNNIIWGIVLITFGLILGLNALEITNIEIFFAGWWTLFIIVPCFISLLTESNKTSSLIGLIIGIILFLGCNDIVDFAIIFSLLFPTILIIIGISLLFKNDYSKKTIIEKDLDTKNLSVVFAEENLDFSKKEYHGSRIKCVFASVFCNLKHAVIKDDIIIKITNVFGETKISIPENLKVKVISNSFFGGVNDKRIVKEETAENTIYIEATNVFGGIEII